MLKFIGTGDLGNATLGNTSAYIKQGKNLLLLDCGTTAYARMQQLNIFEDINKVYIAMIIFVLQQDYIYGYEEFKPQSSAR